MGKKAIAHYPLKLLLILFVLFTAAGCNLASQSDNTKNDGQKPGQEQINNYQRVFEQTFPGTTFSLEGSNGMVTTTGESYYVEQLTYGKFLGQKEQFLAVVRRPEEELAHAMGFYNADLGLFDARSETLLAPIKHFTSDVGNISLFKGQKQTYVFFSGNVTFQGWSSWQGGLYKITDSGWVEVWPGDAGFWENRAVQVGQDRIFLYKIKNLAGNEADAIPEQVLVLERELLWDPLQETFIPAS